MARIALFEHVKLKRLVARLRISRALAVGHLELWSYYVAQHNPDGDVSNMSDSDIEMAIEWAGQPGAFVAAMLDPDIRLLDRNDGSTQVHDWEDWAPEYIKHRLRARNKYRHSTGASASASSYLTNNSITNSIIEKRSVELRLRDSARSAQKAQKSSAHSAQKAQKSAETSFSDQKSGSDESGPGSETAPAASSSSHCQPTPAGAVLNPRPSLGPTELFPGPQTPIGGDEPDGRHGLPADVYDACIAACPSGKGLANAWLSVQEAVDDCGGRTELVLEAIQHIREFGGRLRDIRKLVSDISSAKTRAAAAQRERERPATRKWTGGKS